MLRSLFYDSTRDGDVRRQSTYGWRVLDSAAYAFLNTATWNSEAGPSPSTRLLMRLGQPQWLHRTVGERFKDETVTQCGATKHGKSTEVFWKRCPDTQRGDKQLNTCSSSLECVRQNIPSHKHSQTTSGLHGNDTGHGLASDNAPALAN